LKVEILERELRELGRVGTPRGFVGRVLSAAGIGERYAELETVIGTFFVSWNRAGVTAVGRARPTHAEKVAKLPGQIRFDLSGLTEFEQAVLRKTLEIPRGEVRTYSWVAREIGRPRAVRAVGTALANNPIPILIPCHRVVRSDGVIGNYGAGGPEAKFRILDHEGARPDRLLELARRRTRFVGSRTTKIFCLPSCHAARRIQPENEVPFADEGAARSAGYRPCLHCRPAEIAS
jgi:O-6-methylguanine DNA methyltransferase